MYFFNDINITLALNIIFDFRIHKTSITFKKIYFVVILKFDYEEHFFFLKWDWFDLIED